MKTFLLLLSLIAIALLGQGCMSVPKVIKELAKDPATAHVSIRTIHGTVELYRTNPNLNTLPHSVADGKINVNVAGIEGHGDTDTAFLRAIFEAGIAAGKKGAVP